jgi:uncharacterized membrane protein YtjA (UPF0391 family)
MASAGRPTILYEKVRIFHYDQTCLMQRINFLKSGCNPLFFCNSIRKNIMLHYAIIFLIIAIIAGIFGFGGIAGTSAWIAHVLFVIFLVLFILSLVFGRRPPA